MNEAVVPWNSCQNGSGHLHPLAGHSARVNKASKYGEMCDVDVSYPQYLNFFWKHNTNKPR
ncbi:hypothetical protein N7476_008243 [Penicillium atrosanguineum]|uniref:Uncharacterized protein n=1 Tax=Penicillium atrosanguineum TaxID=1132637 RepID=A0A9W9PRB3_9EURO|nr:hypothetical protein N7476_008243 [Penicillium atrosanguineum]